jgi:hypothetical protein
MEVHMQRTRFLALAPLAALALTSACADNATSPTSVARAPAASAQLIAPENAPNGTHYAAGTSATCSQVGLTISCSSYELAGVGNANAVAVLDADYSATVNCTNKGGNLVEVKSQVESKPVTADALRTKNGRLLVPALSTGSPPSDREFAAGASCPNGNWTKSVQEGSVTLSGYLYTLTFAGFSAPYITLP